MSLVWRRSFAALILMNVAMLLWAGYHRAPPGPQAPPPRPEVRPETMIPLNFAGLALAPRAADDAGGATAPLTAVNVRAPLRCFTLGPFDVQEQANAAGVFLNQQHLAHTQRLEERRIESGYWVFIPPQRSRAEAERRAQELKRLGIRDYYIVQEGERANAVSLGLFSQARNAENYQRGLRKKNVAAELVTQHRTVREHWLELKPVELADAEIARLKKRDWGVGTAWAEHPCDTGAPASTDDP